MLEQKARKYTVSGKVQGVSYRQFVKSCAQDLNITGFVQNERDGTVIACAQGAIIKLEHFKQRLEQGPPLAKVANVTCEDIEFQPDLHDFEIY